MTSFSLIFFLLLGFSAVLSLNEGNDNNVANPFTVKASLIRYWNRQIPNHLPKPSFLLSKASPLTTLDSAIFTKLATHNSLSSHYHSLCSSANLLCFPDLEQATEKHDKDANFVNYSDKNFTNYGTSRLGGLDSFSTYSADGNLPVNAFRRYSRDSSGHNDKFANYVPDGNVVDAKFNTYATSATGGTGEFKNYAQQVNVPDLRFTSYNDDANGHKQGFDSYSVQANAGDQAFISYGKNGNGVANNFIDYGKSSNVVGSTFNGYGETANGGVDTFNAYAFDTNNPKNTFVSYDDGGNAGVKTFSSYRDKANVGDDTFKSYAKNSNSDKVNFLNYGKSFNEGTDSFQGYAKGSANHQVGFKIYGVNSTFKDYNKNGISFANYTSNSTTSTANKVFVNRWIEPGKFFHESMLKQATVMPMPDIRDKMPQRSFLPRMISSKIPFSSQGLSDLKHIFHASDNSTMERIIKDTVQECERSPSAGETKRCVGSVEDMIDFAVSVLGHNVAVRSTESVHGSKQDVMIGKVKGINGGNVTKSVSSKKKTKSVSCHQSLFPYMVYYCHSVPKVRVYEAEILDVKSQAKINHGVAICHLDTSSWSASHGAFAALGSSPGHTEVCHWIFENDMTWTTAD